MNEKCGCGMSFNAPGYMHKFRENHTCRFHIGVGCKVCKMIVDITLYLAKRAEFDQYTREEPPSA